MVSKRRWAIRRKDGIVGRSGAICKDWLGDIMILRKVVIAGIALGAKTVHVGYAQTSCTKGPVFVCTVSAKACP